MFGMGRNHPNSALLERLGRGSPSPPAVELRRREVPPLSTSEATVTMWTNVRWRASAPTPAGSLVAEEVGNLWMACRLVSHKKNVEVPEQLNMGRFFVFFGYRTYISENDLEFLNSWGCCDTGVEWKVHATSRTDSIRIRWPFHLIL